MCAHVYILIFVLFQYDTYIARDLSYDHQTILSLPCASSPGEELRQTNCSNDTAIYAKYENVDSGMAPDSSWRTAYHGTWFYSLRNVLYHGVLLESRNTHIGTVLSVQIDLKLHAQMDQFFMWNDGVGFCH